MNPLRALRNLLRKRRLEAEMAEEMRLHIEMQAERNRSAGMTPDDAHYAAQRQFGNAASLQEQCREQRAGRLGVWIEQVGCDFRQGMRQLASTPGTTVLAVLSLAVGIGINSTIFSVMDSAFLRPLPVHDPETIVKFEQPRVTLPEYLSLQAELKSLAGLVASTRGNYVLQGREGSELVPARMVTSNYFEVLGVGASAGRLFGVHSPDLAEPIVVISHALWQRRFGGDPAIVGQTIVLNERSVTVIGVSAKGFVGEERLPTTDVWLPLKLVGTGAQSRRELAMFGRVAPGVSLSQVRAEAATIFARPEWASVEVNRIGERVWVTTEREARMDHGGRLTYIMGPVVGLVLVVACANVSCLLLGRYEQRRREMAVRLALGASRGRVMRYLLTEATLLAALGAAAGLTLTWWTLRMVPAMLPETLAMFAPEVQVDLRVLGLTLGLAVVATLVFGLMPAWRASQVDVSAMLKSDVGHLGRTPSRNVLVMAQVAIAMTFLAVAALFVRGFWTGATRDLGLGERNLLLAYAVPEGAARRDFDTTLDELRRAVASLPGAQATTVANNVIGARRKLSVRLPGDEKVEIIGCNLVDHGFFAVVGVPLTQGRDFSAQDNRASARVVIVSEAMARQFWPGESPVGKTVFIGADELVPREVIGVVGNVSDLTERDPATLPYFYLPLRQERKGDWLVIVRTQGEPSALAAPLREKLRRMDTPTATFMIETLSGRLRAALMPQWLGAWLGGVLGGLAFVLAVSGLYGVVAYAVARRTRELGIRVALGAAPSEATRLVLRQGLVLASIGIAIGLLLAIAAGSILRKILYGISPADPWALAGAALVVLAVAILASWVPARRAGKVDPMIALRAE